MATQNDRECPCRSGSCVSKSRPLTSVQRAFGIPASKVQRIQRTLRKLAEEHLTGGASFLTSATKPGFTVRPRFSHSLLRVVFSRRSTDFSVSQ